MIRGNPVWQILMGLAMCVAGVYGGCQLLLRAPAEEGSSSSGPAGVRKLREYGAAPEPEEDSANPFFAMLLFSLGPVGMLTVAYGVRELRIEGELLREGVPVVGRINHVERHPKHGTRLYYSFRDEAGLVHEGVYSPPLEGALAGYYTVGQEITVIYDRTHSWKHMLDLDDVRRAEAQLNHHLS